ncbi:MAG: LamG domain-containing protein [Deltaproteobacteria bacterium]|nr:LamG domain-containing protein [Deltaproteobacteria bacterium]
MRGVVLALTLAGCGRLGFSGSSDASRDTTSDTTTMLDVGPDARAFPSGLLAYWPMDDDPAKGSLDDASGNGHIALCATGVSCPTMIAGVHGNAIHVDGSQYARVTWGPWLGTSGPFTYAAFVYVEQDIDQVAFARPVGANVGDSWDAVTWSVASGNGTCLEDADNTGANQAVCGAVTPLDTWVHLAGRWDGATAALFINGAKVGQKVTPAVELDMHDIMIGTDENTGSPAYQFHGRIDDLQLYNRALTDAEILGLAQ